MSSSREQLIAYRLVCLFYPCISVTTRTYICYSDYVNKVIIQGMLRARYRAPCVKSSENLTYRYRSIGPYSWGKHGHHLRLIKVRQRHFHKRRRRYSEPVSMSPHPPSGREHSSACMFGCRLSTSLSKITLGNSEFAADVVRSHPCRPRFALLHGDSSCHRWTSIVLSVHRRNARGPTPIRWQQTRYNVWLPGSGKLCLYETTFVSVGQPIPAANQEVSSALN